MTSSALRQWNARQLGVLERYCRLHRIALTPDLVCALAARYASKHDDDRVRAGGVRCVRSIAAARPRRARPPGASPR